MNSLKTSSKLKKNQAKFEQKNSPITIKYKEKILQIKRVTKVTKGGKKLSFRAIVIVGDEKHKVGIGVGKALDVSIAIEKAILNAKKNLIQVPLTKSLSIPSLTSGQLGAARIRLRPTAIGTGVIAGGSVRTVLELGGVKNVLGKQLGSKNLLNNAKATIKALLHLQEKTEIGKIQSDRKFLFYKKLIKNF